MVVRGSNSTQSVAQLLSLLGSDAVTQASFVAAIQSGPASVSGVQVVSVTQGKSMSSSAPAGRAPVIRLIGPDPATVNVYATYSDQGEAFGAW